MRNYRFRELLSYIFTIAFLLLVIKMASKWEAGGEVFAYENDFIYLLIYIGLGYWLVNFTCSSITTNGNNKLPIIFSFLYYFSAFACFSDGHFAGWVHSGSMLDKLVMTAIIMAITFASIIVPVAILLVAIIHNFLIKHLIKGSLNKQSAS